MLGNQARWAEVNVIGEEIQRVKNIEIEELESKFFKLSW
jgi:hypothetical protein